MKRKLLTVLLAAVLIVGIPAAAFAGASIQLFYNGNAIQTGASPININGRIYVPVRALAEAMGAKVTWDQESSQVDITGNDQSRQIANLELALAPKSAPDAVNSWAQGVMTRNGAWQYAVMTPELKKATYDDFVSFNWVTGVSSPWVKSFAVKEVNQADENTYLYSVTFAWTDSSNDNSESTQYVTVKNTDGVWLVDSIKNLDVKGKITKVNAGNGTQMENIFVEDKAAGEAVYDQATVLIGDGTKIYKGYSDEELKSEALKVGTQVEVTFKDGAMILIYPPQAEAAVIRVF